jgi:hypothetical protein
MDLSGTMFGEDHPDVIADLDQELKDYVEKYNPRWGPLPSHKDRDAAFDRVWRASIKLNAAYASWKKQFAPT